MIHPLGDPTASDLSASDAAGPTAAKPAGLGRRFTALAIDYLIILAYAVLLLAAALGFYAIVFDGIPGMFDTLGPTGAHAIGIITLTLPVAWYLFATEAGQRRATVGKRRMRLVVSGVDGTAASRGQIARRTAVKILPWEVAHTFAYQAVYYAERSVETPFWVLSGLILANVLPVIYVGMVVLRHDHRGPHDVVAGTVVGVVRRAGAAGGTT